MTALMQLEMAIFTTTMMTMLTQIEIMTFTQTTTTTLTTMTMLGQIGMTILAQITTTILNRIDNDDDDSNKEDDEDMCDDDNVDQSIVTELQQDRTSYYKNNVILMALKMKHNLTSAAVEVIARTINVISGEDKVRTSKYFLNRHFKSDVNDSFEIHQICKESNSYISVVIRDGQACTNPLCGCKQTKNVQHDTFFCTCRLRNNLLTFYKIMTL